VRSSLLSSPAKVISTFDSASEGTSLPPISFDAAAGESFSMLCSILPSSTTANGCVSLSISPQALTIASDRGTAFSPLFSAADVPAASVISSGEVASPTFFPPPSSGGPLVTTGSTSCAVAGS